MLRLKQTLHNGYTQILKTISQMTLDLELHFLVAPNYLLVENLGRMLSSLMLLLITTVFLVLVFISNLLWLMMLMLKKPGEQLKHIVMRVWNALCTLCQWEVVLKAITSPYRKLRNWRWQKDGDSLPDSTLAYSEMPGELDKNVKYFRGIHTEEQFEKIRKDL